MTKKHAIHFGAGNIGRGFIGPVLFDSDYFVTFVDVVEPLLNALNNKELPHFTVNILSAEGKKHKEYEREKYEGVNSRDAEQLGKRFEDAGLVTTSVGPNILPLVARSIISGLVHRMNANVTSPINIIACENLVGATDKLKEEVLKLVKVDEDKIRKYIDKYVGFANCAVDRIVPPVIPPDDPKKVLDVTVEEFKEWVVKKSELKSDPEVKDMIKTEDLIAMVERKLFTVNTIHAIIAYLGYIKGYKFIAESINDEEIYKVALGAVKESGAAIVRKYSDSLNSESHEKYIDKIINQRMKNSELIDEVGRVGRGPIRKLGKKDRLIGPALMCIDNGLPTTNLATGTAAALLFDHEAADDKEPQELQKSIQDKGVESALLQYSGLSKEGEEGNFVKNVLEEYKRLKLQKK